ncbi:MAG: hypothetical protein ABI210_07540 [Abditibacteriaceae bacterium]
MTTSPFFTRLKRTVQRILPPAQEPDPDEPVTIATFSPAMRPHVDLLRSRLEADGFVCIINGDWPLTDFVRLQVKRADANEASARLREIENDS